MPKRLAATIISSLVSYKRYYLLLTILFTLGVGSMWGETANLTFTAACGGNGTDDQDNAWTITSDGAESSFDNTKGIHYGTSKAAVQYIKLSTSDISGTITSVKVNASTASGVSATVAVKVGTSNFTSNGQTTATLSTTATDYTFTGSASGEILVTITKPSSAKNALYCKSVEVTYTSSSGGNTGGDSGDDSGDAGSGECTWKEIKIGDIKSSDDILITMTNGSNIWALNSENGTSKAPDAIVVTSEKLANGENMADVLLWNIVKDGDNLTIYPKGSSKTWLYCNNSNDGVRVGTNTNKTFTISGNYLKNTVTSRFVGVYTTNPDWRCYDNTTGNIKGQTLKLYKKVCSTPSVTYTVAYALNGGIGTTPTETNKAEGDKFNLAASTGFSKTGYRFIGWNDGTTTYAAGAQYTMPAENVTFTAQWAQEFTVTYDANGGTSTCTDNNKYIQGETVTVCANIPTKSDVTFAGWSDGTNTYLQNATFTMPAKNVTLTAQWKTIPKLATPANLEVTNITCTGATLSWNNVANNNGYLLSVKNTSSSTTFNSNIAKDITSGSPTLNPGTTYTWKVVAKGDGTNYNDSEVADGGSFTTNYKITYDVKGGSWTACADGCVAGGEDFTICSTVPTKTGYNFMGWSTADDQIAEYQAGGTINNVSTNTTLYAVWEQKTYTVILSENGTKTTLTPQTSTSYTLPDELTAGSCQDDTKELVGWSTVAIPNPGDKPTSNFYELGETVTLTADQTPFYAVFATADGGGTQDVEATLSFANTAQRTSYSTLQQVWTQNGITLTNDKANSTSDVGDYTNPARFYKSSSITIEAPGNIKKIVFICSESKYTTSIAGFDANGTTVTVTQDGTSSTFTTNLSEGQVRLNSLTVTYTTRGGISYSDYTTSCIAVPDPVLSFATTPADPIVFDPVNCGSTTSKAQVKTVQVSGANLQEYVSVEVTGPYKIARTSSTNLSDYTTSLTLDKTNTGNINANYSTIYIISCPPAQSTDATTGTLTFTTKKGNTLTVNLSTPTVNCTTYALTFNDRGSKTVENYYAGVEVPQPEDPTGVCTDPIHYVFDGWAEATVTNGSTEYTKVTFPYTMPGQNKTLYAVYRYLTSGGNGDYNLVTSALDDWSGDYLIAYDNKTFADGTVGGEDGIGKLKNKVDLSSYISNNTIPATEGDKYYVTLEAVTGGYVLKTQDGKYNYHTNNTGNGISASTISFAQKYPINVNFVSQEEIKLCLTGDAAGSVLRYNTTGYFRFYKNGGQEPVYLYKKSSGTTIYTTSPVCGPYVEITSSKDIYVTGGNAGGTHDLVVAQQKVAYQATRLKKDNETGNLPSIQVRPANITYDATKTKNVTITFDEDSVRTLQSDDTYTISGTMTISYRPETNNVTDDIQVVLNANYNPSADVSNASFTIHARSLPQEFVIVAKQGDKWYALNGDMSNGSSANPANGHVVVDDETEPTKATYAPCNTIYTFDGLPNTGDRKFVRFQGTDGAWLWAASGTNVGIQNKSLKNTPSGNMEESKPYNWEIETENNITYFFHNANSSRVLRLNDGKFGMYVGGTDVIRILPYVEKCLYNYAPSNLKVSELKSTYVTLTWDAVAGATKYQYSTDETTWTDGTAEPTVTINGLSKGTNYTYYIRAYHADAGVTQECIDYSEITFTTADCDDVPTDITYTADLNSITVSWTASAATATVKLYSDEAGTTTLQTKESTASPYQFTGLTKNTTYYIQILADGTCASPIIPVKTEDVKVDIVEWLTDGIIVDINTNETVGVTLENEVSYGSGTGAEATELFFSKYYEATGNVKLVAIYNGTKNIIDLTDYEIHYGKDSWESQYITLKDFGETKGQIQPGEELILYTTNESDDDNKILDCVNKEYPDGKWVRVTQTNNDGKGHLSFAGNKTLVLKKDGVVIDVIGALTSAGNPTSTKAKDTPSWGDAAGWNCATGLSIADDTQIGISTNRCLLIRNNTVTSGANAVTSNIDDFVTLCSEWKGAQVPDNNVDNGVAASCENFAYVGTFDYSDYYTQFETMGDKKVFDENARNADGTVNVPITDLYKQSCRNIRITLEDKDGNVLSNREYKVPIMITTSQGTDGQTFIDLQQNLAMVEVENDQVVATHPLSLDEVREICKTCDVVIRDNATLMKMDDNAANDHPQVRDIYVYENSSLIVPNGTNYTINNLSLRRKGDDVASLSAYPEALILPESAAAPISLDFRLSAESWHWFTLPYDCKISEVTWVDGSPAQYNVDWFLMTYDGEKRAATQAGGCWKAYTGTTIKAGEGFIIAINGNINNPAHTYELRFPMSKDVLVAEGTDKKVDVRAWGVETDIRPNHKGWNLVGNPYLAYYQRNNITNFEGLRLGQLVGPDPQTGYWEQTGEVPYVVVPVGAGWVAYEQVLASETDLLPFTAYFVQVGNDGTHNSTQDLKVEFDHTKLQLSATPMPASIIQRSASEVEEPVIVGVSLTNAQGESDKTSLVIDNQFTDEYEMNADFFKWFGDYYKYYTKPVLYTLGADNGKRAFNALSEELASQPISLGMFAAKAGNYTFSLDLRSDLSKVQEVWLYDATQDTYTNLLQDSYTFQTAKTESAGRFFLSVKMAPKVSTDIDNITNGSIWATTQDHTIIVNGLLSNAQLWIYDATGKLLHTDQTQYYQHSYSVPVNGTYFVRVQNTMQTQTIKVVVE